MFMMADPHVHAPATAHGFHLTATFLRFNLLLIRKGCVFFPQQIRIRHVRLFRVPSRCSSVHVLPALVWVFFHRWRCSSCSGLKPFYAASSCCEDKSQTTERWTEETR